MFYTTLYLFYKLAIAELLSNLPQNFSNRSIIKLPTTVTTSMLIISFRLANCFAYLAFKLNAIHFNLFRSIPRVKWYQSEFCINIFLCKNNNSSLKNVALQLSLDLENSSYRNFIWRCENEFCKKLCTYFVQCDM